MAESKELANDVRLLRIRRMLVPKPQVWLPLIQETSSAMLCTGVTRESVRVKLRGEKTKRKEMALSPESP
jgi:hypothetical protein